ncbi:alkyl sulfatase dimerization domain-containing protein [Leifsonia sp. F6_8S_P_1B]|uniref:Alkyl sulfatase dimerization domain-containing protein n=1 Tax=Leifsonia williamsii TaxID=3035919 RepID=A0ABT8K9Y6_9MICO|nr:alkyl sulfatase dimerization domain-containing protein [Leifsonia williamsii]MDN4613852.1 alkyl sulfatase dimerization domain-containing protein [Leifsonia williamsii]
MTQTGEPSTRQSTTLEEWEAFFDSFKQNLAPVAYEAGPSISWTEPAPTVHPEQTAWARQMAKRLYEPVAGRVYVGVGYQLCSTTVVVGEDGLIVIDPGENDDAVKELLGDVRRFTDLPVTVIVYTHRHPDHCYALEGLGVSHEDVDARRVDIVAHETFEQWLINDAGLVGPILTARTSLVSYAGFGAEGMIQGGLGTLPAPGPKSTHLPTITTGEVDELTLAGLPVTVFHAYGDAQDEIDLWFPTLKHVHGSETIQGETFPNLYTLRGTAYRDPEKWREGVDALLAHARQADTYSGSHMRPWVGNDFIVERIMNYRDAIQFIHDQSIRFINQGATAAELVDLVAKRLPAHVVDDPWLQPYYGAPEHCVRAVYDGVLGWYNADPTELAAPLHADRARRYVQALGGREAVLRSAREAIDAEEFGWAAELLTHLVRADTGDADARGLKAEALRQWGYRQKNIYWRNLSLGAAKELDGTIDYSEKYDLQPKDVQAVIPAARTIANLRVRLDPAAAGDAHTTIGFRIPDTGEEVALEIRRGVAVVHDDLPAGAAATVTIRSDAVRGLSGGITEADALVAAADAVDGDETALRTVLGWFDPVPERTPPLVGR